MSAKHFSGQFQMQLGEAASQGRAAFSNPSAGLRPMIACRRRPQNAIYNCTWKKADGGNLPAWFDEFLLRMP
jgi:hypothetical protein